MAEEKLVLRPKRPKGEDGYKTFSIRIKEELVGKIDDISARTGYSRNELIGKFLEFAAEHCTILDK
jgi:hypothetical protein